jgi:hypothetical protein
MKHSLWGESGGQYEVERPIERRKTYIKRGQKQAQLEEEEEVD